MWTGVYWTKVYWAGNYWNPVSGAIVAAVQKAELFIANVGRMMNQ